MLKCAESKIFTSNAPLLMSGQPKKATMKDNYLGRVSSGLPLFFSFQIIHKRLNKLNLVFQNRDNVYSDKGVLVAAGI